MLHPAVLKQAYLNGPSGAVDRERLRQGSPVAGNAFGEAGQAAYTPSALSAGAPEEKAPVRPVAATATQRADERYQYGQQYLNNPLEAGGRRHIGRQFMNYPLGGHVRDALEGQEVFGHHITSDQALYAERGLAGLTAVGVGVPAFMLAVQQLSTPPDQGTIPL